ncbi:hypothetical protein [Dysosmobacter welbionis]|uniref:hypothetical protein n=1 Tax=Dysosmobacter welbionis TaxID=2093857 RepID=UPI0029427DF2|nr:hypothetical protein [Dysosmobacter welbionis]
MKYYQGVDYFLFFMDFPHMGVPGVIASNSDGTANIYINTLYCEQVQSRTIKHELRHLVKNHFYIDWMSIEEKELEADDIDDPSCVFSDDFSCVEYVEYHKPKLPNVFRHGTKSIPIFNSLEALRDYMFAMREQVQNEKTANRR